eukprot:227073_1
MSHNAVNILTSLIDDISGDKTTIDFDAVLLLICGYIRSNCKQMAMYVPFALKVLSSDFYGHYFNQSVILKTMKQRFNLFTLLTSNASSSIKNINETKLLWKLSDDGDDGNLFLDKLRNSAPYLFVMKTEYGNICGGYTTFDCNKSPIKEIDKYAFVFVLEEYGYYKNDIISEIFPAIAEPVNVSAKNRYNINYFGGNWDKMYLFIFGPADMAPLAVRYRNTVVDGGEGIYGTNEDTKHYDMKGYEHAILCGTEHDQEETPSLDLDIPYEIDEIEIFHVPLCNKYYF